MKSLASATGPGLGGVRTQEALPCPICRSRPLLRAQTVCSPACRARRHRQRREEERQERDAQMAELLRAALRLVAGGIGGDAHEEDGP